MSIIKTAYVIIAIIKIINDFIMFCSQYDRTALHYASMKGHPAVVKLLVQSHSSMNVTDIVSIESPH